jgi:hypothetical protein
MSKIIIENRSDLQDFDAVELALRVMEGGRVSNFGKQYCYLTVVHKWKGSDVEYQIASFLNKESDRFVISGKL